MYALSAVKLARAPRKGGRNAPARGAYINGNVCATRENGKLWWLEYQMQDGLGPSAGVSTF